MNASPVAARRAARLLLALPLALLLSCASAGVEPPVPEWPAVPAAVLNTLCERLRIDAVAHEGDLALVKTTQPIVSAGAIAGLARRNMKSGNLVQLAEDLSASQKTIPLLIPRNGCAWKPIEYFDARKQGDMMVVELSSPMKNPFARGEAGMFARVTLGGTMATWYWVPFRRNMAMNDWVLDRVAPLGVWE